MSTRLLPWIFAGIPLLALPIFFIWGSDFVGGPDLVPSGSHSPVLDTLANSVDHLVSMLTSISFGLFVLIGFSVQNRMAKSGSVGLSAVVSAGVFMSFSFISLYFGYAARVQALEFIADGYVDFSWVLKTIGSQALFLGLSCPAAFFVAVANLVPPAGATNE